MVTAPKSLAIQKQQLVYAKCQNKNIQNNISSM